MPELNNRYDGVYPELSPTDLLTEHSHVRLKPAAATHPGLLDGDRSHPARTSNTASKAAVAAACLSSNSRQVPAPRITSHVGSFCLSCFKHVQTLKAGNCGTGFALIIK